MTTITIDETHPEWKRAEEFCKKHFGNSVIDLGYDYVVRHAIHSGENVTRALEQAADEDNLDYLDGSWGHMKPNLAAEHATWSGAVKT